MFSVKSKRKETFIQPKKVRIDGIIVGSFYSGQLTMVFSNDESFDYFIIYIGKQISNKICLHDFDIKIDKRTFLLHFQANDDMIYNNINDNFHPYELQNIPNFQINEKLTIRVLPKQQLFLSAHFELPLYYFPNSTICIFFPLICHQKCNNGFLSCSNFSFSLKIKSPYLIDSINSNPKGRIDTKSNSYIINKLESFTSKIVAIFESKYPIFQIEKGFASCSGNFGQVTFIPTKNETLNDHSEEEFVFMIDQSMIFEELKQASQCFVFFLKSLPSNCYFNIIIFDKNFVSLFPKPIKYTNENARIAMEFVQQLKTNFGQSTLSSPLHKILTTSKSNLNKKRRIFILTSGLINDIENALITIKKYSVNDMINLIGIGHQVDRNKIEKLAKEGRGFSDYVVSGIDLRSMVIKQLTKVLNDACNINISIENNENLEIVPLSTCPLSQGVPVTFYFKTSNKLTDNLSVFVNVEGNSEPMVYKMKQIIDINSQRSFKCVFYSEKIKYLVNNMLLYDNSDIQNTIIDLSLKNKILSPFTYLIGSIIYESEKEKEEANKLFNDLVSAQFQSKIQQKQSMNNDNEEIIKTILLSRQYKIYRLENIFKKSDSIGYLNDVISDIFEVKKKHFTLTNGHKDLGNDGYTLKDYSIENNQIIYFNSIYTGGGLMHFWLKRFYISSPIDGLISIVFEQRVEGYWENIPLCINNSNSDMIDIIGSIENWVKKYSFQPKINFITSTMSCLVYMLKYEKEFYDIWFHIYNKSMKWLISINRAIDWEQIIHSF